MFQSINEAASTTSTVKSCPFSPAKHKGIDLIEQIYSKRSLIPAWPQNLDFAHLFLQSKALMIEIFSTGDHYIT